MELVKKTATKKFDETVDAAINLGVDPKHADQVVRGAVVLPHGMGKTVKLAVFAKGDKAREARRPARTSSAPRTWPRRSRAASWTSTRSIATPDMMGVVGRLGKVLGPRGLMPNPKVGHGHHGRRRAPSRSRRPARSSSAWRRRASSTCRSARRPSTPDKLKDNFNAIMEIIYKAKPADGEGRVRQERDGEHDHGPGHQGRPGASSARQPRRRRSFRRFPAARCRRGSGPRQRAHPLPECERSKGRVAKRRQAGSDPPRRELRIVAASPAWPGGLVPDVRSEAQRTKPTGASAPAAGKEVSKLEPDGERAGHRRAPRRRWRGRRRPSWRSPRGSRCDWSPSCAGSCREAKVDYRVVKNTLAARAAKGTPVEPLAEKFVGPTAIVMSLRRRGRAGEDPRGLHEGPRELRHPHRAWWRARSSTPRASGPGEAARPPGAARRRSRRMIAQPATKLVRLIGTPGQQLARVLGARKEQLEKQLAVTVREPARRGARGHRRCGRREGALRERGRRRHGRPERNRGAAVRPHRHGGRRAGEEARGEVGRLAPPPPR